jgi:predicted enzyme related to lactoylglutathione lyase
MIPVRAAPERNLRSVMADRRATISTGAEAKLSIDTLIVDVQVRDLSRATAFYRDVLGLTVIHTEKDWSSFEAGGAEIHLYIHGGTEYGIEFRVTNIEKEVAKLKARGVQLNDIMEFPWGTMAFFQDSEGNQLVLVHDT